MNRTAVVVLSALLLTTSVPASAVIFGSDFDPPDFFGSATFDLSPTCLSSDGFHTNAPATCTVTWLTAVLTFRQSPVTSHTLTFDYSNVLPDPFVVNNVFIAGGNLAGVNSGVIGPRVISGDSDPTFNGPFWISFSFSPSDVNPLGIVSLFTGSCDASCFRNPNPTETAHVDRFFRVSAVPEPETLGLLLAAVGAGWSIRRRKHFDQR